MVWAPCCWIEWDGCLVLDAGTPEGVPAAAETDPSSSPASDEQILELLHGLLRRSHLSTPSNLAVVVADEARSIGARDVVLYLIDYEQGALVPVPGGGLGHGTPLSVAGTVAGRAFSSTSILRSHGDRPGLERLYLPLLDGTERVGVIGIASRSVRTRRSLRTMSRSAGADGRFATDAGARRGRSSVRGRLLLVPGESGGGCDHAPTRFEALAVSRSRRVSSWRRGGAGELASTAATRGA